METRKRKLKNLLIDRWLQLRIILNGALYMLVVCVVTIGIVQFPMIYDMVFGSDLNAQYRAAQSFLLITNQLIPAMSAVFIFFFLHQVVVTHRVCGPFVNFTRTFQLISRGDMTRKVKLRRGDYLHKEGDEINRMMEGLTQLLSDARMKADALRSEVDSLAAVRKTGPEAMQAHLANIETGMHQLQASLAGFKLPAK